jgi:hypothetical protein
VAKSCDLKPLEERVEKLKGGVEELEKTALTINTDEAADLKNIKIGPVTDANKQKKLEALSAHSVNLDSNTKSIRDTITELKGALKGSTALAGAPDNVSLRPGLQTLIQEAGGDGLGSAVDDFSVALQDMVGTVKNGLQKERIAMMTTQDVPVLLRDTVIEMNNVNRVATALRARLASITELANLLQARAGTVGHARAKAGAGAPVAPADEASQGQQDLQAEQNDTRDPLSKEFSNPGKLPYTPEEVEDADVMREVYEAVDKTVRGAAGKTQTSAAMRNTIAQAVLGMMRKQKMAGTETPDVKEDVPPKDVIDADILAEVRKAHSRSRYSNAPVEIGDDNDQSNAKMVQEVLDELRSTQTMHENRQTTAMLGFGDINLAPVFAGALSSVLGAASAPSQSTASASPAAATVLMGGAHRDVVSPTRSRASQWRAQQQRTAAMHFL